MKRVSVIARFVALASMLLHAGFVARHYSAMAANLIEGRSLEAALSVICHPDGTTSTIEVDQSNLPVPAGKGQMCPICSGLSPTAAVLPTIDFVPPYVALHLVLAPIAETGRLAADAHDRLPPPRGPPLHA